MATKQYNNLWLICGPESSGSVFIAKTISYAIGHCKNFGDYSGYGKNNKNNCENLVWHQSVPSMRPKKYAEDIIAQISYYKTIYKKINIILTTRDRNISIESKMRRFGDTKAEALRDLTLSRNFFSMLAKDPMVFIWSYETMILLGECYFIRLYNHFGINSNFVPSIYDGNYSYVLSTIRYKAIHRLKILIKHFFLTKNKIKKT